MKLTRIISSSTLVILSLVVLTGCRRKKLDLSGLRGVPENGSVVVPEGGNAFNPVPSFPEVNLDSPLNEQGKDGEWGSTDEPLKNANGGSAADAAGTRWSEVVYFAYDSSAVGPSEIPKIESLAATMKANPGQIVIIEGHCDQRGSDEYNRNLGQARAFVIRDYLVSLGTDESAIETISYGEERPADPNATDETGYQKNRRAEFVFKMR